MRHLCSWILLSIALLSTIGAYLWRPQVTLAAAASEPVDAPDAIARSTSAMSRRRWLEGVEWRWMGC
jgi:hypothetical protein